MDIYGHGQSMGQLLLCYCRKQNIDVDKLLDEIDKNKSMFISGMHDGVGADRESSIRITNSHLEYMKVEDSESPINALSREVSKFNV